MKKLLVITLVLALALGLSAGAGLAVTKSWNHMYNEGVSKFEEMKTVFSSMDPGKPVGFVHEIILHDGAIEIEKYTEASPDEMVEIKTVTAWIGEGDSCVYKWVEATPVFPHPCHVPTTSDLYYEFAAWEGKYDVWDEEKDPFFVETPYLGPNTTWEPTTEYGVLIEPDAGSWTFSEKIGINRSIYCYVPDIPEPVFPESCLNYEE